MSGGLLVRFSKKRKKVAVHSTTSLNAFFLETFFFIFSIAKLKKKNSVATLSWILADNSHKQRAGIDALISRNVSDGRILLLSVTLITRQSRGSQLQSVTFQHFAGLLISI